MRIICVHQGYELYGSDRCFIESVAAIRAAWPDAEIEVVLPRDGPIVRHLREIASRIVLEPIFVARRRDLVTVLLLVAPRWFSALWRAIRRFRSAALTYLNTVGIRD